MTYTKLIERLNGFRDYIPVAGAAADAIEALQEKNALLEGTLESRERNIAALQAENERLKAEREALRDSANEVVRLREQLQSRMDAMGKGEAIYQFKRGDGSWFDQTKASYDYNVKCGVSGLRIVYAAPKALAPLTDEQVHLGQWDDGSGSSADFREGVRFAERKHGIHAKGGQHEDA